VVHSVHAVRHKDIRESALVVNFTPANTASGRRAGWRSRCGCQLRHGRCQRLRPRIAIDHLLELALRRLQHHIADLRHHEPQLDIPHGAQIADQLSDVAFGSFGRLRQQFAKSIVHFGTSLLCEHVQEDFLYSVMHTFQQALWCKAPAGQRVEREVRRTLDAKLRLEKVSPACRAAGATLQNMSALASPPSESCSSIVSLEFLRTAHKGQPQLAATPCLDISLPASARSALRAASNLRMRASGQGQIGARGAGAHRYGTWGAICMSAEKTLPSSSRLRLMFCASVSVSPAARGKSSSPCMCSANMRPASSSIGRQRCVAWRLPSNG
jgi:hypothetical protein